MTDDQKLALQTARDAAMAVVLSRLKPVQFNTFQAIMAAWQVYRAAKVSTQGGGGPPPVK